MTDIRMAVFDLDHTLIGTDLVFSDAVRQAVAAAQDRGVFITIATGRDPLIAGRLAKDLGAGPPIIAYQGAVVWDYETCSAIKRYTLPRDVLPRAFSFAAERGLPVQFEMDGRLIMGNGHRHREDFYKLLVTEAEYVTGPEALVPTPNKFLCSVDDPARRDWLEAEMNAEFGDELTIVGSHALVIEGLPKGVSKGRAVAWLAGERGVPAAQVLAMGDNDNDVSMIRWAGIGVAVADGSVRSKAAADWIAPGQQDDGVAAAIRRFILEA